MKLETLWERRQKLFDKCFAAVEADKATTGFWAYIGREFEKLPSSPEDWRAALIRCGERHPRTTPEFQNHVSDAEVEHLLQLCGAN